MNDNYNADDEIRNSPESMNTIFSNTPNETSHNLTNHISMQIVKSISGWGMFRAIIDIIIGGFSCLGGILFLFVSFIIFVTSGSSNNIANFYGGFGNMSSNGSKIIGLIFLLFAIVYPLIGVLTIIYSVNLIRAIDNLKGAISLNNESYIIEFLNKISKYFKFNGIVSIIKISLTILLFIFYIILIIYVVSAPGNIMNDFNNSGSFFQ